MGTKRVLINDRSPAAHFIFSFVVAQSAQSLHHFGQEELVAQRSMVATHSCGPFECHQYEPSAKTRQQTNYGQ
jgi:hypothetical protein